MRGGSSSRLPWRRCAAGGGLSNSWTFCTGRSLDAAGGDEFGLDPALIPAAELKELSLAWHRLDPWPDSVQGLTRLKAGYIIAPLSNGNVILLLDMAKRAGPPWDAILGGRGVARAYKTAPEAYLRTADILAMRPEEVCSSRRRTPATWWRRGTAG